MKSYMVIPIDNLSVTRAVALYNKVQALPIEAGLALTEDGRSVLVNAAFNNADSVNLEFLEILDATGIEIIELVPYSSGKFEWF